MATYTVKRSEWFRGQGGDESKLLRADGRRCCIGFVGQQLGIPDEDLLDIADVYVQKGNAWPDWMRNCRLPKTPIVRAYDINDDESLTDTERESRLIDIFASQGDTLLFVD